MKMNVIKKGTDKMYEVYDITYDNTGYPHFLIYEDRQWTRISAKYFRPLQPFDKLLNKWLGENEE